MKKFFVMTLVLVSLLASCKQVMDETEVNGRVVDIITGEGVEGVEILLKEDENCLTPDACGGNVVEEITTDQDGNFSFAFKARPANKWQYYVGIYEYSQSFIEWGTQTLYFTKDTPFEKQRSNTVLLKVAPKASLWIDLINDTSPSPSDTIKYIYYNSVLSDGVGNWISYGGSSSYYERNWINYPAGPLIIRWQSNKNGQATIHQDSIFLKPGGQHKYTIHY